MPAPRSRVAYAAALLLVMAAGLGSRVFARHLPAFVAAYAGDTLYATVAFALFGIDALRATIPGRARPRLRLPVERSRLLRRRRRARGGRRALRAPAKNLIIGVRGRERITTMRMLLTVALGIVAAAKD